MLKLLVWVFVFLFVSDVNAFIKVGSDIDCDFNTINAAIPLVMATQDYELRIANNQDYQENLEFDNVPISLIGGYNNCTDAQTNTFGINKTKIDGSSLFKPVLVYANITNSAIQLNIKNLELYNGLGNIINLSGGINLQDVDIKVMIESVSVHDNIGEKGGAIYSSRFDNTGDLNLVLLKDVNFDQNTALDGGGIYCSNSQLYIYGDSIIQSNQALGPGGGSREGDGGGIYAASNCNINLFSGHANYTLGVVSNTANGNGGGLFVEDSAHVVLDGYASIHQGILMGNNSQPVTITNNITNFGDGAGIYLKGNNTRVDAYATIINYNSAAGSYGGGVSVSNFANFTLSRKLQLCWDEYLCNQIFENKVFSSTGFPSYGGALSGQNNVGIEIKQSLIYGNQSEFGTVIYGDSSDILVESSILYKNGKNGSVNNLQDKTFIHLDNQAELIIGLSTIATNQLAQNLIQNNQSSVSVLSSIIQDSGIILSSNLAVQNHFECLVAHEQASFNGVNIETTPAVFVDALNDDYHLLTPTGSTCSKQIFLATVNDVDDDYSIEPYLHGADQMQGNLDLVFKSGFE